MQLIAAFKLKYQEVDNNDRAYILFRSTKQDARESVDDFYERMMKLAKQFTTLPTDNFLRSNFRAGLPQYLHVASVGLPRTTLDQAKQSAKRAESGLAKDHTATRSNMVADPDSRVELCISSRRTNHGWDDCWKNPTSTLVLQQLPSESWGNTQQN